MPAIEVVHDQEIHGGVRWKPFGSFEVWVGWPEHIADRSFARWADAECWLRIGALTAYED